MRNYFQLQAYELFCLLSRLGPKNLTVDQQGCIKELGLKLDEHFLISDFMQTYEHIFKANLSEIITGEDLFVDYDRIDFRYINREILSEREKILIAACVQGWVFQHNFTDFNESLLFKTLELEEEKWALLKSFLTGNDVSGASDGDDIFLLEPAANAKDELEGNWVESNVPRSSDLDHQFLMNQISHCYRVLFLNSIKIFLLKPQDSSPILKKNGIVCFCEWDYLEPGDSLQEDDQHAFDYSDLKRIFLDQKILERVQLNAQNISYRHRPGKGIHKLNLSISSGTLVGILGKEGTGKSTILNLLAGEIVSPNGDILVNGYSYKRNIYQLKGMIGYVPEQDMLLDELTVFDNLLYSAKLYLGNLTDKEIRYKIERLLKNLELWPLSDTVVGSFKEKKLQPGQRRLLNIALELIRNPYILIVDNAVSSLSLSDSTKILEVLAEYSFQGRIVITSITQTDAKTFQYFDRLLLLDDGGFPILYRKIGEAWNLLASALKLDKSIAYQPSPNDILQLLDATFTNEQGGTNRRYKTSDELYELYKEDINVESDEPSRKTLPENILQPPTLDRQYVIFNLRNFKAKLARSRELLVTLIASPILALLLSLVMRGNSTSSYRFIDNSNIPAYYYISIIIALFLGMVLAAKEIFREKPINRKQAYLNISKFSYINSKITYLFAIVLVQSLLFVSISHLILQIYGMLWMHILVFFSCEAFGILIGLLLSENQSTLEAIYSRSIPVLILLQLLFGGGLIPLDKIPGSKAQTPLISDFMVSRWAFEAAMVYQFRNNDYSREFYDLDRSISLGYINSVYIIPELKSDLEYCVNHQNSKTDSVRLKLKNMARYLVYYPKHFEVFPYENTGLLTVNEFNTEIGDDLAEYLEYLDLHFHALYQQSEIARKQQEQRLIDSLGTAYLAEVKEKYVNHAIEGVVTNQASEQVFVRQNGRIICVTDQIYQYPHSDFGRTQLFVPQKMINGQLIDAVEYNISVIWLFNLLLYVMLVTGLTDRLRNT